MTTYEKIVKGATKVKVAPPKTKYIEPILMATNIENSHSRENLTTIMRALSVRLQDLLWSVVFKLLIVLHIMIREGVKDVTLDYLVDHQSMMNLSLILMLKSSSYSNDVRFVIKYAKYLQTRVKEFNSTGIDYIRDERSQNSQVSSPSTRNGADSSSSQVGGRLRSLTVEKGLLRETSSVQKQIDGLLKNNFMENEINNDIVLTAFRLLVNDLLALFQELNEGVINLLEHYFEMSKFDAESALKIYKKFVDQTKYVIDYLRVAKHLEYATKLHVPTIKHAPTALTSSLEEYLDDPNFELNRRQFLQEKANKEKGGSKSTAPPSSSTQPQSTDFKPEVQNDVGYSYFSMPASVESQVQAQAADNGRVTSLIVQQSTYNPLGGNPFNQQQVMVLPFQQQPVELGNVFVPVQAVQVSPTGVNFGYAVQPQSTGNPFLQQNPTGAVNGRSETNPFLVQTQAEEQLYPNTTGYQQQQLQQQQLQQQQLQQQQLQQQQLQQQQLQQQKLQQQQLQQQQLQQQQGQVIPPQGTGNPFLNSRFTANSGTTYFTPGNALQTPAITSNSTGNPFKVSNATNELFNNVAAKAQVQQPLKSQPTAGGLENLPTIPVFPETQSSARQETFLNGARTQIQQQQQLALQLQQLQQQGTSQFNGQPAQQFSNPLFQATGQFSALQNQPTQQLQLQNQATSNFSNSPFAQQPTQGYVAYQEPPSLI